MWSNGLDACSAYFRVKDSRARQFFFRDRGPAEPHEAFATCLFLELVERRSVVLDLGAFIGWYAILAAKRAKYGRVLAVEPDPESFVELTKNAVLNRARNLTCASICVGATSGLVRGGHAGRGLQLAQTFRSQGARLAADDRIVTSTVRVADLCSFVGLTNLSIVKMDIEGAEFEVLLTMRELLESGRPTLLLETHVSSFADGHSSQVEDMLRELGYELFLAGKGPLSRPPLPKPLSRFPRRNTVVVAVHSRHAAAVRAVWRRVAGLEGKGRSLKLKA